LAHPRHPLADLLAAGGLTAQSGLNAALLALHSLPTLSSAAGLPSGRRSGLLCTAVVGLVLLLGRLPGLGSSRALLSTARLLTAAALLSTTGLLLAAGEVGSLLV
jgi:hypothetical protein